MTETVYKWVGGPLDGAQGEANPSLVTAFGDFQAWIAPDPADIGKLIAYQLMPDGTAQFSKLLTEKANKIKSSEGKDR